MSVALIGYARCSSDNKTSPRNAIGYASSADLLNRAISTMAAFLGRASLGGNPNVCYYPGVVWTSPLRETYHTTPPPIINDLPQPCPRPHQPGPWPPARSNDDRPILQRSPSQPDPPLPDQPHPLRCMAALLLSRGSSNTHTGSLDGPRRVAASYRRGRRTVSAETEKSLVTR